MHSLWGLKSFPPAPKMEVACVVFVYLTDGICSLLLLTLYLLENARLKIQRHMWYSRGVSHGAIAKSQTGCKCKSAFLVPMSTSPFAC